MAQFQVSINSSPTIIGLPPLQTYNEIDNYDDINIEDKEKFNDNPKTHILINSILSTQ